LTEIILRVFRISADADENVTQQEYSSMYKIANALIVNKAMNKREHNETSAEPQLHQR